MREDVIIQWWTSMREDVIIQWWTSMREDVIIQWGTLIYRAQIITRVAWCKMSLDVI